MAFSVNDLLEEHVKIKKLLQLDMVTQLIVMYNNQATTPQEFSCVTCGRGFATNQGLLLHRRRAAHGILQPGAIANQLKNVSAPADIEVPAQCTVCFSPFRNRYALASHMRVHIDPPTVSSLELSK